MLTVAVVGPTATGKSDLAIGLARSLTGPGGQDVAGEVVNADAFQLYRGMDIGTAKVPPAERGGVAHHQLDVLDVDQDASVARFQTEARADLDRIAARGARAVVAGGSGLYVRALLDRIDFPGTDPAVRARLEARAGVEGTRALYDELARRDPAAAWAIEPRNTKRIVRALEVVKITGEPFSAHLPRQEYERPSLQIGLDCARDVLDERVARRVELMREQGLVDEVRALAPRLGRTASRAVGYAEILAHLRGECTEQEALDAVVVHTRRLTRRQMSWFGRDPRVHWLQADDPDLLEHALAVVAEAEARRERGLPPAHGPEDRRRLGT
ncbi:MAG: tRNA (adenosine(37)-N6)-dimethylallyltransferase MiaA [Cellulomonadaceae bacterium]